MNRSLEIVGGGLAGLSLGRVLALAGVPVTVFEAQSYPRHRVCGEFICGLRPEVEAGLGLTHLLRDAQTHRTLAWHWNENPIGTNDLPRPARGLSRHTLDERLARAFSNAGGNLQTHRRVRAHNDIAGRVWTTGRRKGTGAWLGLKVHCRGLRTTGDLEFHLAAGAYVGLSAVEGGAINVCGLFRRDPKIRAPGDQILRQYLRQYGLAQLADRVAMTAIPGSHTAVAAISFDRNTPRDRLVLGDAFAMIPPFTGDGMAIAFESAWIAAGPLLDYARGATSWARAAAEVRRRIRRRFARRLAIAGWLQRLMLTAAGQRGLAALTRRNRLPFRLLYNWLH